MQQFCARLEGRNAERRESPVYHRELLIIQSSGSGKSRLISEALKSHLGILFNVRNPNGTSLPFNALPSLLLTTDDRQWLPLPGQQRHQGCIENLWTRSVTSNWAWVADLRHPEDVC